MKQLLITLLIFLSSNILAQISDTTFVQTFTYDSISTRRATFSFPSELEGKQFEKVLMYYNIKCDPLTPWDSYNCGEWDYLAYSHIFDHTGQMDSNRVETSKYLVNGESPETISYVTTPYYHYYQSEEQAILYDSEADTDITLGTGTEVSNALFGASNTTEHSQVLWKNTELSAVGLVAGEISKLRFDITSLGSSMGHLTIKMKHTSTTELTHFDNADWTTVYDKNTTFDAIGINTLNLTFPFNYDGSSDLLLDISFDNASTSGTDNLLSATNTTYNSVAFTTEKLGHLNISSGNWAQTELSNYDFENEITISFWAAGDADLLPVNTSIIESSDSISNRVLNIHFPWSNSRFYWDAGEGVNTDRIDQLATEAEIGGEWHHWAFTKNTTTGIMNIYKNGVLWLSGTDKNRTIGDINRFIIGSNNNFENNWSGLLDEFRIWDTELSAATISEWMERKIDPSHPNYSDLVTYYDFDNTLFIADQSPLLKDAMTSSPAMVNLNGDSRAGFILENKRPNITFVQGDFTSSIVTTTILDSTIAQPIDILTYAIDGRKFVVADIIHPLPNGYSYTFNTLGEKTDSTWHEADVILNNETLIYYETPFEIINRFEIGRFITPYGIGFNLGPNGFTYLYDVTDYQSLLSGDVDFQAHNTQELVDIRFAFIEGTPPRDVLSIERLWNGQGNFLYKNLDDDVNLSATEIPLDPAGEMFKVRSRITGHGHNGSNNCCEWGFGAGRNHELLINGTLRDTWEIWQEEECADNPNISQGGTWPYAREGWCPGDIVEEHEFDISPFVTPGETATIDYDIQDVPTDDPEQGNGNYVIAMHMVTYGGPNFDLDAAVIDVLNPNEWEYYSKWNPTCQNPRILIKNTGATNLTSCTIDIWIGGFDNVLTYEWTGDLEFLEEEMVEIPITPEWWADFEGKLTFNAQVRKPNNGIDAYEKNNIYRVNFEAAPSINDPFYIWFKTNNKASENEIYLKDSNGEIIYSRTSLENSTDYKDTMNLPTGCYTLELYDSDHDGIGFWYSAAAEGETTGFLRLRKVGGGTITTFDTDFGRYTKYSFSVGYTIGIAEETMDYDVVVYPNPSNGSFNITLDNFSGNDIAVEVYNKTGNKVLTDRITETNPNNYLEHQMNLGHLAKGVYHIKIISEDKSVTKKIVIQ